MAEPSPAQLRAYAHELRELAAAQDGRAVSCEDLLSAVTGLDDDATWSGSFSEQTRQTVGGWSRGLRGTAADCRAQARSWRAAAGDLDEQADHAAALRHRHGHQDAAAGGS